MNLCTNPLRGWKHPRTGYIVKVTKSNVVAVREDPDKGYISIYDKSDITPLSITAYIDIPCRSCPSCFAQMRREWISRAVAEAQCHDKMLFATFTYADDKVPKSEYINKETGEVMYHQTLRYKDFQDFLKRFRKKLDVPIRYFVCGEYGSHTYRPHYHAIIYGIGLDDIPEVVPHSKSKTGDILYSSLWLDNVWNNGYTLIADASTATIAYVAGYVVKKPDSLESKQFYDYFNVVRPFLRGSLKPALGSQWFEDNISFYSSIYDYHSVPTGDNPVNIYLTTSWKKKYEQKLYESIGYDAYRDYEDDKVSRRVALLDDIYDHFDIDMSRDDYNHSLNDDFRKSSKRKRGVY